MVSLTFLTFRLINAADASKNSSMLSIETKESSKDLEPRTSEKDSLSRF